MDSPVPKTSNKEEILKRFQEIIPQEKWNLFEVGSGSGHHAVFIAAKLKNLQWFTSDIAVRQSAITKTIKEAKLLNVHGPQVFEVGKDDFPKQKFNAASHSSSLV
jgi:methylase of polypeptide subunit release factors